MCSFLRGFARRSTPLASQASVYAMLTIRDVGRTWDADGAIVNMLFYPACATVWEQCVLHGGSSKRLAPPRNTRDRKHLQSTQSTVNRQTSQTKHQSHWKGRPRIRLTPINTAAVHTSAQQQPAIITRTQQGHHQFLSANAARCEA